MPRQFQSAVNERLVRSSQLAAEGGLRMRAISVHLNRGLSSPNVSSAFLSCYTTLASQFLPENKKLALQAHEIKAQSLQLLRESITDLDQQGDLSNTLAQQVLYLFECACFERSRQTAAIHVRILEPLLDQIEDQDFSFQLLCEAMYFDVELASLALQPPLINPEAWRSGAFTTSWRKYEAALPTFPASFDHVHVSVQNAVIRQAMTRLRIGIFIYDAPHTSEHHTQWEQNWLAFIWWAIAAVYDATHLLNLTIAFPHRRSIADTAGNLERPDHEPEALLQRALAFTTLCTLRKYGECFRLVVFQQQLCANL